MQILVIAGGDLAGELRNLGHQVEATAPSLRAVARARADLAYLGVPSLRIALSLSARRVPFVLRLDRIEAQPKLQVVARLARAVVTTDETVARHAVDTLGARDAYVIVEGFSPGDRDDAKERLRLQPSLRLVTMAGELAEDVPLEILAEAHRKLSGTGLLVVGDGPRADFVQAMRATTRPSSPVIFFGEGTREETELAIRAAHVCFAPGVRWEYAACARRQVVFAGDPAVPGVRVVGRSALELRAALEEAIEAEEIAPFPPIADLIARQIAEVFEQVS